MFIEPSASTDNRQANLFPVYSSDTNYCRSYTTILLKLYKTQHALGVYIKWHEAATHAGYVVVSADALSQQSVSDLPGEDGRTLPLVGGDLPHHCLRGYSRFTPPYGPGPDGARLVVAAQDLTHTAVWHLRTNHSQSLASIRGGISEFRGLCWHVFNVACRSGSQC